MYRYNKINESDEKNKVSLLRIKSLVYIAFYIYLLDLLFHVIY